MDHFNLGLGLKFSSKGYSEEKTRTTNANAKTIPISNKINDTFDSS
jgi:hypothetical protein